MSSDTTQVWINQGDIILVGLRDYQDGKADVILKYTADEARNLRTYKELPEHGEAYISIIMFLVCPVCDQKHRSAME